MPNRVFLNYLSFLGSIELYHELYEFSRFSEGLVVFLILLKTVSLSKNQKNSIDPSENHENSIHPPISHANQENSAGTSKIQESSIDPSENH